MRLAVAHSVDTTATELSQHETGAQRAQEDKERIGEGVVEFVLNVLPGILSRILAHGQSAGAERHAGHTRKNKSMNGESAGSEGNASGERSADLFFYNENFVEIASWPAGGGGEWREEEEEVAMFVTPLTVAGSRGGCQNAGESGVGETEAGAELSECGALRSAQVTPPLFYTMWMPLNTRHVINVLPAGEGAEDGEGGDTRQAVSVRVHPGEMLILASSTRYCHSKPCGVNVRLWNCQFSRQALRVGGASLAFSVACPANKRWQLAPGMDTRGGGREVEVEGEEGKKTEVDGVSADERRTVRSPKLETGEVLAGMNGVRVYETGEGGANVLLPLVEAGDCAYVPGKRWHMSCPTERNVMLLKMVVFFVESPGEAGKQQKEEGSEPEEADGGTGDRGRGDRGRVADAGAGNAAGDEPLAFDMRCEPGASEQIAGSFGEVVREWDRFESLPPSSNCIWVPYNDYLRNHMRAGGGGGEGAGVGEEGGMGGGEEWSVNQLRNVRRVTAPKLARFLDAPRMAATAQLIARLAARVSDSLGRRMQVYDLHFLRQRNGNAASFALHQDVHDTGDAASTSIAGGCSMLLGRWHYTPPPTAPLAISSHSKTAPARGRLDAVDLGGWGEFFAAECSREEVRLAVEGVSLLVPGEVRGGGVESGLVDESAGYLGCDCTGGCRAESCPCMAVALRAAPADARNLGVSVYECGPNCDCCNGLQPCPNRRLQAAASSSRKRREPSAPQACDGVGFEVFATPSKGGWGVRATREWIKGSAVMEYVGEPVKAEDVGPRRQKQQRMGLQNYLIVLKETITSTKNITSTNAKTVASAKPVRPTQKVLHTAIDAAKCGNASRFVNHSCEPNLLPIAVRTGNLEPRIGFFALRAIAAGEELTISYGSLGVGGGRRSAKGDNCVQVNIERRKCECGAERCCGVLPFDDD